MRRTISLAVSALCLLVLGSAHAQSAAGRAGKANQPPPAAARLDEPPAPEHADGQALPPLGAGSVFALLPSAAGKSGASGEDVARAITEHLKASGFRVLPAGQVHGQLSTHALEGCKNPTTCDPALALATLGADAVISTAVWQRKSAPTQVVVYVRRQHGYGQAEVSVAGSGAKGVRTAAVSALQTALEDSQHTHEIDVLIESLPMGATVHVDQTLSGTTPARFALLPGSHLVSVEAPGYVTSAQYLELAEDKREATRLQIKLSQTEAESAAAPKPTARRELTELDPYAEPVAQASASEERLSTSTAPRDRASGLNYVVAAVLLGVAAPFIANAIYAGATRGKCVGPQDTAGLCSERVSLGPAFFVSVGVGSVAALTGAAFLVVQPLTESGPVPQGAQLSLTQRF